MIQLLTFMIVSILLLVISWRPLHHPGSHGFYRFFAWETILGLIVIDAPHWFVNPFAWHQLLSWLLLILSIPPLLFGIRSLRTRGMPDKNKRPDPQLLGFEKTTQLVTSGLYRYIRHPLYCSLLLLTWGTFFKVPSQTGITLAGIATLFLQATGQADEKECLQTFGVEYQEYMLKTKMFIPFIF